MPSLCQEHSTEVLHCPADSKRNSQGEGYTTMAGLLEGFEKISCLPRKMNLMKVKALKLPCAGKKRSGTIPAGWNTIKPNYFVLRERKDQLIRQKRQGNQRN